MGVIVEFGIPHEQLAFSELFVDHPDARLEFELAVSGGNPDGGRLIWVSGIDAGAIPDALESVDAVQRAKPIFERPLGVLCEVVVEMDGRGLWTALAENHAYLLAASGSADGWQFHVLFPDRRDISPFIQACRELDVEIETRRVDTAPFSKKAVRPSEFQADALEIALEKGYWEVPRSASLQVIADELGISDQAASERLRRGIRTLVAEQVANDGGSDRRRL